MQIFISKNDQTWEINPYVTASFFNNTLQVFSKDNVEVVFDLSPAEIGDSFIVHVFGNEKAPILEKLDLPQNRGDRILWALSFVESEKRVSSLEGFWEHYSEVSSNYGTTSIMHYQQNSFAFLVAKKRTQIGKGHNTKKTRYKPCLAWCSDTISNEDLDEFVKQYRRYRKIYCPIDFLKVL